MIVTDWDIDEWYIFQKNIHSKLILHFQFDYVLIYGPLSEVHGYILFTRIGSITVYISEVD